MSSRARGDEMSLQKFDEYCSAMENASVDFFQHHLERFVTFLERDHLMQLVLEPLLENTDETLMHDWLKHQLDRQSFRRRRWVFPNDQSDDLALRFNLLMYEARGDRLSFIAILLSNGGIHISTAVRVFKTVIAEPFSSDLWELAKNAATIQSQDASASQAVPISRIPADNQIRIFLSHKSENKELVKRYHRVLAELGFKPWLDEPEMPAGTELDRGILTGINKSCAVVFFITEEFCDERILADEIDYAKGRKRDIEDQFSIITLRFSNYVEVPQLLKKYVWKDVENDLDGLYEIVRALPIELGPVRWKESAVK